MPLFNPNGPLAIQVGSGNTISLFSPSDTVAASTVSRVIAIADGGINHRRLVMFQSVTIPATIYGSNVAPTAAGPQNGESLSTLAANAAYQDTLGYAFYWALATGAGPGSIVAHVS